MVYEWRLQSIWIKIIMEAIINIYECVYRTESGKELYTKTWYAPTWEHAFRMAEIYRTVTLHEAFDFILKRI